MLIHDEWLDSKGDFCGLFHPQLVHLGAEIIRPSAQRLMGSTKDASLGDSTQGQFPLRRCSHCWSYGSAFLCGALKVGDVRTMAEFVQLKEEEQKTKIDLFFLGEKYHICVEFLVENVRTPAQTEAFSEKHRGALGVSGFLFWIPSRGSRVCTKICVGPAGVEM